MPNVGCGGIEESAVEGVEVAVAGEESEVAVGAVAAVVGAAVLTVGETAPSGTGVSVTGAEEVGSSAVEGTTGAGDEPVGIAVESPEVTTPAGGSSPAIDPEDNDTTMTTDSARITRKSVKVGII